MPLVPINRNGPCPCGSGLKFKKCCGNVVGRTASGEMVSVGMMMREAIDCLRKGALEPAVRALETVVEHEGTYQEALYLLGRARADVGRLDEAEELLRRAAKVEPKRTQVYAHLAAVLLENGKPDEARRAARAALELDPKDLLALDTITMSYERLNDLDKAHAAAEKLLEHHAKHPSAVVSWARVQRRRGELAAARERLEEVLLQNLPGDVEARALGELGQILDQQGEYDAAFDVFRRAGNAESRRPQASVIDPHLLLRRIEDYRKGLTPELLRRTAPADVADGHPVPIFLVGFARSGTTMLEQVLAAHPRLVTSDEKPFMRQVRLALGRAFPQEKSVPAMLAQLSLDQIKELRTIYWKEVESLLGPPAGSIVVHKNPMDLVELGIVNVLFPEAKVIVALRDPRAACLSCFMQSFGLNEAMIHFLSIERTARLYEEMMGLWKHVREGTSLEFIEVRYEDAVQDLEREARRMLDLIGVEWSPTVLDFHLKARERAISTPSAAAVSEPIHDRAVARWRHYEKHLEKVADKLAPFVREFGYEAG